MRGLLVCDSVACPDEGPAFAALLPWLRQAKRAPKSPFYTSTRKSASGSGRSSQGLDLGSEATLVASSLVLVEQTLVGDRVDRLLGGLEQVSGLRAVTGENSLLDVLD